MAVSSSKAATSAECLAVELGLEQFLDRTWDETDEAEGRLRYPKYCPTRSGGGPHQSVRTARLCLGSRRQHPCFGVTAWRLESAERIVQDASASSVPPAAVQ